MDDLPSRPDPTAPPAAQAAPPAGQDAPPAGQDAPPAGQDAPPAAQAAPLAAQAAPPAALAAPPARRSPRGPLGALLDLFSSIWLGVTLLTLLFIYCSIGSAGLPIRRAVLEYPFLLRPDAWMSVREMFELTEFAWFHWWPFDLLIALICLNLVVATLRRIPFNVVNLGVWMIHSGIILLAIGSVWYFGTKVEGDAPVARRQIVARVPGAEPVTLVAAPGRRAVVGQGPDAYRLEVTGITPNWELLSGEDAGDRAYKVSVSVQGPTQTFIRELLAGYPQYTEDLVRSDDPRQPFARAKKTRGTALVDETLELSLDYQRQTHFYLRESAAVFLREVGSIEWIERPILGMPRFRDHVASYDDVWTDPGTPLPPLAPIAVDVPPVDERDPLPDVTFHVTEYLRYALMQTRRLVGGDRLDPVVDVRLDDTSGRTQSLQLLALDPRSSVVGGGALGFHWASTEAEVNAMTEVRPPVLEIAIGDPPGRVEHVITAVAGEDADFPFTPIDGTDYAFRVMSAQDGLVIQDRSVSLAIVEIRQGERAFTRWVFEDPRLTRDLDDGQNLAAHAEGSRIDPNITTAYRPGRRAGLTIVAGPSEETLRLLIPDGPASRRLVPLAVGQPIELQPGITLTATRYSARTRSETRPFIVPPLQRDRDVGVQASMIRLHVPAAGAVESRWLPYHLYPFERPEDLLTRFRYEPTTIHLADGRHVELMFSRERMALPAPVVLDDFVLRTHIGGYGGNNASVRDWTSSIRFAEADGWSAPVSVSVNDPKEREGFWFFQSQWDPPVPPQGPGDPGSQGLNYTVLGVGNREGVALQLFGCVLSVVGMIYAFYVKPAIKRRRRQRVYAETTSAGRPAASLPPARGALVGVAERGGGGVPGEDPT